MLSDYFKLHFLVFIWGFTVIIGLYISVSPIEVVFYRTAISAVGCWLLLKWYKISPTLSASDTTKLLLTGGLVFAHWFLFFLSARVSNASVCVVGLATTALWTSILEPLSKGVFVKWYEVFLGLCVIVGLGIIFKFELDFIDGLLLSIFSAMFSAAFSVINGKMTQKINHVLITYYEMLGALISTVICMPILYFFGWDIFNTPMPSDFLWLAVLSIVCTVYAYSVSVELLKRISVFASNLTINLEPVYGIILAYFLLDEHKQLTSGFYYGTLVILGAVFVYPLLKKWDTSKQIEKTLQQNEVFNRLEEKKDE